MRFYFVILIVNFSTTRYESYKVVELKVYQVDDLLDTNGKFPPLVVFHILTILSHHLLPIRHQPVDGAYSRALVM